MTAAGGIGAGYRGRWGAREPVAASGLGDRGVTIDYLAVSGDRAWSRVTVRGNHATGGEPMVITFLQQIRAPDGCGAESWSLTAPEVDWTR